MFKNSPHGHKSHILVTHCTRIAGIGWTWNVILSNERLLLGGVKRNNSVECTIVSLSVGSGQGNGIDARYVLLYPKSRVVGYLVCRGHRMYKRVYLLILTFHNFIYEYFL